MVRVSVCIATYNGEKYIKEQIDSIITQLTDEDEIIISDDHSTDNTINIIKQYNDSRIKIFLNENEKGYTENFENALKKASGQYIFLSDQDDKWVSDKVNITLKYLIQDNYDMVISDCIIVDENLNTIKESYFKTRKSKAGFLKTIIKANYLGCCMAFNREVFKRSVPFPGKYKYLPHDLWIGLIGYAFFKVKTTEKKLILYRRHAKNVSDGGVKSKNTYIFKVQIRVYAMLNIIRCKYKKS